MGSPGHLLAGPHYGRAGTTVYQFVEAVGLLRDPQLRGRGVFVSREEIALYTFKTSTTWTLEKSFNLLQSLISSVVAALRTLLKSFLEDMSSDVLSSEQYTMAVESE